MENINPKKNPPQNKVGFNTLSPKKLKTPPIIISKEKTTYFWSAKKSHILDNSKIGHAMKKNYSKR